MKPTADNECGRLIWLLMQREAHRRAAGELRPGNTVRSAFEAELSSRDRVLLERFDRLAADRANEILSAAWAYRGDAQGSRVH
jgi:hypothetical protein